MESWAAKELERVDLGDVRLERRLFRIVERLSERPEQSIPAACQSWAETKGTYRFFSSKQVEAEKIILGHRSKTIERMKTESCVLVAQDTSELNYTAHKKKEGLGGLRHSWEKGLYLHTGLAIRLDGVPLGLVYQQIWARKIDSDRSKAERRITKTKDKESQRWIDTLRLCQDVIPADKKIVVIADREADMYDLLATERQNNVDLLVRAVQNRRVDHPTRYLQDAVLAQPPFGQMQVEVSRQGERPPRLATLVIRYMTVAILPPYRGVHRKEARPIHIQVILANEVDPPRDEPAISWWLLTTLPVQSLEDAKRCIQWYSYRWLIERFHFVLKSGCCVESLQLENAERLERALATYSIVAWRLLWLTYLARLSPEQSCLIVFEPHEWQSLHCFVHQTPLPPSTPPSLKTALLWIAQLGGFLARKRDGVPGVQTIWRGLRRLSDISDTWLLSHPLFVGND